MTKLELWLPLAGLISGFISGFIIGRSIAYTRSNLKNEFDILRDQALNSSKTPIMAPNKYRAFPKSSEKEKRAPRFQSDEKAFIKELEDRDNASA